MTEAGDVKDPRLLSSVILTAAGDGLIGFGRMLLSLISVIGLEDEVGEHDDR